MGETAYNWSIEELPARMRIHTGILRAKTVDEYATDQERAREALQVIPAEPTSAGADRPAVIAVPPVRALASGMIVSWPDIVGQWRSGTYLEPAHLTGGPADCAFVRAENGGVYVRLSDMSY
jgi:pyruvate/2-oxoglutarate dehydrogenase complex dihydrolipoamide acyltransferase (E2) component